MTRICSDNLATMVMAASQQRPDAEFADVLLHIRELVQGRPDQDSETFWKSRVTATHQGEDESITDCLPKFESANCPEEATVKEVYILFHANLAQRTRDHLERLYAFSNRTMGQGYTFKIDMLRRYLYAERKREQAAKKQVKINAVDDQSMTREPYQCRTCQTNDHSWKMCDRVRAKASCRRCNGAKHLFFECPRHRSNNGGQPSSSP